MLEENLSRDNLKKVAGLLSGEKPITKKLACELLGINYNTARLDKLILQHQEAEDRRKRLRAAKQGTPLTPEEYNEIANEYLAGTALSTIAESLHRGIDSIKTAIEKMQLPLRTTGNAYLHPELIPEGATRSEFDIGEQVWSVKYQSLASVEKALPKHSVWGNCYRIWLSSDNQKQYANQPACELASLKHLTTFGVTLRG